MKKFDLVEALKANGFEASENAFGCKVYTLELSRMAEVAWYGVQELRMAVRVTFDPSMASCSVSYSNGGREPFKTKVHLADKRCWNAILQTLKNKDFEIKEVA